MDNQAFTKLKIKTGHQVLILNSPEGYAKSSTFVDLKPVAKRQYDAVLAFVKNTTELHKIVPIAIKSLKDDGLLWMCYPKKTSSIKSDISRDSGWHLLTSAGYEGVSLVSLDETWSSFRFKKNEKARLQKMSIATATEEKPQVFTAQLEKPNDGMDTAYISIPFDVEEVYGTRGMVKVKALFDGHPYRGILSNMGTGSHIIIVRKDVRQAINKKVGENVRVQLQRDTEERVVEIPAELLVALGDNAKARNFFDGLSFTNRKEYANWITSAKKEDTRLKRIKETIEKLVKGKKNPTDK